MLFWRVFLRQLLVLALVFIVLASLIAASQLLPTLYTQDNLSRSPGSEFHFGVSFCGNTTFEAKVLIDKVKNFTNLFVVQSGPVSVNESALNEIVNYAVASGLDVIAYFGYFNPNYTWQVPWLNYAKQQWGSNFLGIYMHDEPGGVVLDANWTGYFKQLSIRNSSFYYQHQPAINLAINGTLPLNSYQLDQAAYHFVDELQLDPYLKELKTRSIPAFTSDYALYWFDYKGGYDTIFAELGSNQSTSLTIALARGAADIQNKTWGTIITWTYNQPPYLVNGTEMYTELLATYTAGAQYAVIFDYPQLAGNPYGILTEDHFGAMQRFRNTIHTFDANDGVEAALILPHDYGWGMRNQNDTVWGLWPADAASGLIWNATQKLLAQYGLRLNIVYDDPLFPLDGKFGRVYWWNQTL
jgi:hypothetical protein